MAEYKFPTISGLKYLGPGEEIECDRAFITDDAVFVRKGGIWIELRPLKKLKD